MPSQNTHQTNGNTVNDYDQDSNIVRSKFPQPNYPNVSLSEYISERISSHPEDALAFVSFVKNFFSITLLNMIFYT